jgi:SpoIID/LytB domain protein
MKLPLLLLALSLPLAAQTRPPVKLLRSQHTYRQLGWRGEWEWKCACKALQHLGLTVEVVEEAQLVKQPPGDQVLIACNARNLEESTLMAIRRHLASGGKLFASYQTSYRKADNGSWSPNGLALGPEMGVKFLRWNGSPGETETLQVAPPYGEVGLARHQAMLAEALPGSMVLAQWKSPAQSPAIVQNGSAIYVGEDLLAPENTHSPKVLGLVAGLLNRLEPKLRLSLPRTAPPLLEPIPPFTNIPAQGQAKIRVGLGPVSQRLRLRAGRRRLEVEVKDKQLWVMEGGKAMAVGSTFRLEHPYFVHLWQENENATLRWSAYRGALQFELNENGLQAYNELPQDAYLAGVIPSEVPFSYPSEALKAMAVVARSYALSHLGRHSGFDVCSEVHCQVYRGLPQEHANTNAAVLATKGQLLKSGERIADATFHACCGGHTADVATTWSGSSAVSYLEGQWDVAGANGPDLTSEDLFRNWLENGPAAYCSGAGRYRWEEKLSWSELENRLRVSVPVLAKSPFDSLQAVEVTRRLPSGRVGELRLQTATSNVTIQGDSCRWLLSGGKIGAGGLQSTLFYLDVVPGQQVRFRGGGWGHGVGLCQEGAAGRARAGQTYQQILTHYYPGTRLTEPNSGESP